MDDASDQSLPASGAALRADFQSWIETHTSAWLADDGSSGADWQELRRLEVEMHRMLRIGDEFRALQHWLTAGFLPTDLPADRPGDTRVQTADDSTTPAHTLPAGPRRRSNRVQTSAAPDQPEGDQRFIRVTSTTDSPPATLEYPRPPAPEYPVVDGAPWAVAGSVPDRAAPDTTTSIPGFSEQAAHTASAPGRVAPDTTAHIPGFSEQAAHTASAPDRVAPDSPESGRRLHSPITRTAVANRSASPAPTPGIQGLADRAQLLPAEQPDAGERPAVAVEWLYPGLGTHASAPDPATSPRTESGSSAETRATPQPDHLWTADQSTTTSPAQAATPLIARSEPGGATGATAPVKGLGELAWILAAAPYLELDDQEADLEPRRTPRAEAAPDPAAIPGPMPPSADAAFAPPQQRPLSAAPTASAGLPYIAPRREQPAPAGFDRTVASEPEQQSALASAADIQSMDAAPPGAHTAIAAESASPVAAERHAAAEPGSQRVDRLYTGIPPVGDLETVTSAPATQSLPPHAEYEPAGRPARPAIPGQAYVASPGSAQPTLDSGTSDRRGDPAHPAAPLPAPSDIVFQQLAEAVETEHAPAGVSRPSPDPSIDLDLILETLAQEIQREYKRFYGD